MPREWYRHQIGFARNEVSRRYVFSEPECWIPSSDDIRERDPKLKQGSKENAIANADEVHEMIAAQTEAAIKCYNNLLENNVAPEIARFILPQSMYTSFIETGSLAAYARLCNLRLDPTAQKEIQLYAEALHNLMIEIFPVSWKALSDKFKNAVNK